MQVKASDGALSSALLATIIAARHVQEVQGLILLAPAFRLRPYSRLGVALAKLGLYHFIPSIKKAHGVCDTADPEARKRSPAYDATPLKPLIQFDILQQQALQRVALVKCPVFAAFGKLDQTVDSRVARALLAKFSHAQVFSEEFPRSQHVLPIDLERDQLADSVIKFCQKITADQPSR